MPAPAYCRPSITSDRLAAPPSTTYGSVACGWYSGIIRVRRGGLRVVNGAGARSGRATKRLLFYLWLCSGDMRPVRSNAGNSRLSYLPIGNVSKLTCAAWAPFGSLGSKETGKHRALRSLHSWFPFSLKATLIAALQISGYNCWI
jgi:hypothetical protein